MTHAELVEQSAKWLHKKCAVVITELVTNGEEPDAIGWQGSHSTLLECKVSRADFMADRQKGFRRQAEYGIGQARYYVTPTALVSIEELPPGWGLLEYDGKRMTCIRKSEHFEPASVRHEIDILLSALRRIGLGAPAGVSIKHYVFPTRNKATLGLEAEA